MPRCEVLMFCIERNWNDLKTRGLLEHLSYDFVHPCEVRGHVILSCCPLNLPAEAGGENRS